MRIGNFGLSVSQGIEKDNAYIALPDGAQYSLTLRNHFHRRADATVTIDGKVVAEIRLPANGSVVVDGPPDDPAHSRFTFMASTSEDAKVAGVDSVCVNNRGLISVRFQPESAPITRELPRERIKWTGAGGMGQGVPWRERSGQDRYDGLLRSSNHVDDGGTTECSADEAVGSAGDTLGFTGDAPVLCSTSGARSIRPQGMTSGITGLTGSTDQRWITVSPLDHDPAGEVVINVRLVVSQEARVRPLQPIQHVVRENPVPAPVG